MAYITSERVSEIRKQIKSAFPKWKFSITRLHCSTVRIVVLQADINLLEGEEGATYQTFFSRYINDHSRKSEAVKNALNKISDIAHVGHYDNSDIMTDYFDAAYYVIISIGDCESPFIFKPSAAAPAIVAPVEVVEAAPVIEEVTATAELAPVTQCYVGYSVCTNNAKFTVIKVKEVQQQPEAAPVNSLQEYSRAAYSAYYWQSFNPESAAARTITEHENMLAEDLKNVPDNYHDKYISKFKSYFSAWLIAQSRCASSVITGPANFQVDKMERNRNREHSRYQEFTKWRTKVLAMIQRSERKKTALPELEQAIINLNQRKVNHEAMKAANVIVKKHKGQQTALPELIEKTGWSDAICRKLLRPDYCGRVGFAGFSLTNNLAQIKRLEARVKELQAKNQLRQQQEENGVNDCTINGARIQSDATDDRLKIHFEGKPAANVIVALKRSGFRWSPFLKCWCRKLTRNAQLDAARICKTELQPE